MQTLDITQLLRENAYPGRGILLGNSADGRCAVVAYFIMGRSENSRNRIFVPTADGIRTQAHDEAKMTDPSLVIYHPVRKVGDTLIVTNGDQTDTIQVALTQGESFENALGTRAFEPDGPNFTPRISGLLAADGSYQLSILKSRSGDDACCCRYFYEYAAPTQGVGHFIHTYAHDGTPLPSFEGEPREVSVPWPDAHGLADALWNALNEENKVSLFVRYIDLATGAAEECIVNRHE